MGNAHATPATAPATAHGHGHDAHGHGHDHDAHSHGHDAHGHDAHGHGHGADNNGKVVAAIVVIVLLGLALKVGRVLPAGGHTPRVASTLRATGTPGIVVLQSGEVLTGPLHVTDETISVRVTKDDETAEYVVDRKSRVRWFDAQGTSLTDDYWSQYAGEPLDAQHARAGGGIVVLDSGQVLVGRVTEGPTSVTVRWPYGSASFQGEVTIPLHEVRFVDTTRDTLSSAYWDVHEGAKLDPAFDRSRPAPANPTPTARTRAELAQTQGEWAAAARAWAEVCATSDQPTDLVNLRECALRALDDGMQRERPEEGLALVRELLGRHAADPLVREALGRSYRDGALYYQVRRDLDEAARWSKELRALGGELADLADKIDAATAHIRAEQEAEEHEHEGEGRRPG